MSARQALPREMPDAARAAAPIALVAGVIVAVRRDATVVIDILWEAGEFLLMRSGASGLRLTYENTIQIRLSQAQKCVSRAF